MVDVMGSWGWGCDGVSWTYRVMGGGGCLKLRFRGVVVVGNSKVQGGPVTSVDSSRDLV